METQALWRQVLGIKYKYPSSSCAIDFQLIKVGGALEKYLLLPSP